MEAYKEQSDQIIFALDIGTRSIVGIVGEPHDGKLKVLAVEAAEHEGRAMIDGQIDNIQKVAELASLVTSRLEERLGISLQKVCVAAAGRALQMQRGSFLLELPEEQTIDQELISRLETGAVSDAEMSLQAGDSTWKKLFLVGYTVAQYRLDHYPLTKLSGHRGKELEADVVATFLPSEVVESLYSAMKAAGLQVVSMTLEPIAAMNAAIPAELRLLNLALVDIGAGTTDIAVCSGGSVVGYTMATIAGDEITESIMRAFLVDFATAEQIKRTMEPGEKVCYTDILGLENELPYETVEAAIEEPMDRLAKAIAKQILEVNTTAPSALFLAGGGSKLKPLRGKVAEALEMEERRVAVAGTNIAKSAFSDGLDLGNPEYTTPLGIAISAGLGLLNDSYRITLNGKPAKLFRSGVLTARDVLLMNGYTYQDMIGRTGRNLTLTVDGRRTVLRGEPSTSAILQINGESGTFGSVVRAGDALTFTPAVSGRDASSTLGELLGAEEATVGRVLVNNEEADRERSLRNHDVILTLEKAPKTQPEPVLTEEGAVPEQPPEETETVQKTAEQIVFLNDRPLALAPKENGQPYFLMDLLEYSEIDFETLDRPVLLRVNGAESSFQQEIRTGDHIDIRCV